MASPIPCESGLLLPPVGAGDPDDKIARLLTDLFDGIMSTFEWEWEWEQE